MIINNEEIRDEIHKHQDEIQKILAASYTFELNPEILKHKQAIDELRKQCNHLNPNHEVQVFNGRCVYCGTKMQ